MRYGSAIAGRLHELGCKLILTTRDHPDTITLSNIIGEDFKIVGEYNPASLSSRLKASIERELALYEMFQNNPPDLVISHQSIEACRVGFGLGIPVMSTADSPHSHAVNRLTMSLLSVLVISKAIPEHHFKNYEISKVLQFNAVDEVAWIKNEEIQKQKSVLEKDEKPTIVVRQMETKASYIHTKIDIAEEIAKKLTSLGKVMFLPRYDNNPREGLLVPKEYIDSVNLVKSADLLISFGGTMAREAALQGTPSIVLPLVMEPYLYYTNNYLSKLGFPIFNTDPSQVFTQSKKYLGMKWETKTLLEKLENPLDKIENFVKDLDIHN